MCVLHHVLQGPGAVRSYLKEAATLGFDEIELSAGFISLPDEDLLRLVKAVKQVSMSVGARCWPLFCSWNAWRIGKHCADAGISMCDWCPIITHPAEQQMHACMVACGASAFRPF